MTAPEAPTVTPSLARKPWMKRSTSTASRTQAGPKGESGTIPARVVAQADGGPAHEFARGEPLQLRDDAWRSSQ